MQSINPFTNKSLQVKIPATIILTGFFIGISYLYDIHKHLFFRPQGIHVWRQTDCLSIAQNYYQRNTPLCQPEIHNLISDGNTSGKTAGEFPILYFLVAQLWKVFGKHEFIYRLFTLLLWFMGLFYLFKFSTGVLNNRVQSGFVGLILFTSPAFVYYSVSFLPNIPALAFSLSGAYFMLNYFKQRKEIWLWISILCFTLGMLLKVSAGIGFIALLGWCILETVTPPEKRTLFRQPVKQILPFLCSIMIVITWYSYAEDYNAAHGGRYTFNNIWPIWELSLFDIKTSLEQIRILWKKELFHPLLFYVTGALWIILVVNQRKLSRMSLYFLIILPFGCLLYLLLWFQALPDHDYYYLDVLVFLPFLWLLFFHTFKHEKWLANPISSIILASFLIFLLTGCRTTYKGRFSGWMNEWHENHGRALGELEFVLRKAGIHEDDLVISLPDHSINSSLYLMNQRGYTNFGSNFSNPEIFRDRIEKGARYLVLYDSLIERDPVVKYYTRFHVTSWKSITVYDLRPYKMIF